MMNGGDDDDDDDEWWWHLIKTWWCENDLNSLIVQNTWLLSLSPINKANKGNYVISFANCQFPQSRKEKFIKIQRWQIESLVTCVPRHFITGVTIWYWWSQLPVQLWYITMNIWKMMAMIIKYESRSFFRCMNNNLTQGGVETADLSNPACSISGENFVWYTSNHVWRKNHDFGQFWPHRKWSQPDFQH